MTARKYIPPGTTFNSLTYLHDTPQTIPGRRNAMFRCACGTEKIMVLSNVTSGKSISCGCEGIRITRERSTTHGMSHTPTHRTYRHMLERCYNPKDKRYADYAGRGIVVCDRWRESFENFLSDMGKKPDGLTLDRINNNGNYEPRNCRWATPSQQTSNTRRSIRIVVDGVPSIVVDLAARFGVGYESLRSLLRDREWPISDGKDSLEIGTIVVTSDMLRESLRSYCRPRRAF